MEAKELTKALGDTIFRTAAGEYYDVGLAPLPAAPSCKRPLLKWAYLNAPGARRPSRRQIERWADRNPGANIGTVTGVIANLTVVDVDGDESVASEVVHRCGDTPIKIRSPSGGFHLWFRHNGEKTIARPPELDGLTVDVRGHGGFIALPPSQRLGAGLYEFVEGGLADVAHLPVVTPGSVPLANDNSQRTARRRPNGEAGSRGDRNKRLFDEACRVAHKCRSHNELLDRIQGTNIAWFRPPLPNDEVKRMARSVWAYRKGGRLLSAGAGGVVLTEGEYAALRDDPAAMLLYMELRRAHPLHAEREQFAIDPEGICGSLPGTWYPRKLRAKRAFIIKRGLLRLVHQGGRFPGDPSQFVWG